MGILSAILGVISLIQFLLSIATGSSLRAKAQTEYNDWYRVAELGEQIASEPQRANELLNRIMGIADANRNGVKAYSREKLGFVPTHEPAWEAGPKPIPQPSIWRKIALAFVPK
jgi:hypothetical protein